MIVCEVQVDSNYYKTCADSTKCEICLSTECPKKYGRSDDITIFVKQVAARCDKRKGENIHVR